RAKPASSAGNRSGRSPRSTAWSSSAGSVMAWRQSSRQSDAGNDRRAPGLAVIMESLGRAVSPLKDTHFSRPAGRFYLWSRQRMATLGLNDVKTGKKILHNGDPWVITEADFIKPGKGQAFTRIRIRNLKDGRTTEQTLKSSDSFEEADVTDTDMQL